jgi:hypothetical protein
MKKPLNAIWIRLAIFIAGALFLFYFLPRPDNISLSYELNRPWTQEQLIAPFDFPVYRDSLTIKHLEDSIRESFVPVFAVDNAPLEKITTNINSSPDYSASEKKILISAINKLYTNGIIDQKIYDRIQKGELRQIKVRVNNANRTVPTATMRSSMRAYNALDSMLVIRYTPLMLRLRQSGLSAMLTPNYVADEEESERLLSELIAPVKAATEKIQKGQSIISRGDLVTPELYQVLRSYDNAIRERAEKEGASGLNITLGQLIFSLVIMAGLYFYLALYRREIFNSITRSSCLVVLLCAFFIFSVIMAANFSSGLYIVPFAILPILLVVFFDTSTALFVLLLEVMLCASFSSFAFEFVVLEMTAGIVAVFSMRELSRRSQLLRTAAMVFGAYVVTYSAIELMQVASLNSFSWKLIGFFAVNMVLTSFAYVLIFVVEKIFGFTSVVTLVELSDINNPVLRELSEECPGTFQHSLAVSNLASDAARRVDANVQLVRAGALYHDIGKIKNPAFFTENQHGVNPHDALDPIQSARIIISHVTDGLRRAEKAKLPTVIRDIIAQHHGRSTARYFLTTYQNAHPGEEVDPAPFTYPGPNPQSKEASLLMMADVVEAASRSLPSHDPQSIANLVNRLIDAQVAAGLHSESTLSFRDITIIKQAFIDRLRTMYHARVAYPSARS